MPVFDTRYSWQPIETAEYDGAERLVGVWADDGGIPTWCQWVAVFDGGNLGYNGIDGEPPTHCMRLPPPPTV